MRGTTVIRDDTDAAALGDQAGVGDQTGVAADVGQRDKADTVLFGKLHAERGSLPRGDVAELTVAVDFGVAADPAHDFDAALAA